MKNSQNIEVCVYNKNNKLFKKFSMRKGSNLWVWLRKNGLPIGSACSGVGVCGACHITIYSTDPAVNSISPQTEFERSTLCRNGKNPEERLACLTRVYDNLSIKASSW